MLILLFVPLLAHLSGVNAEVDKRFVLETSNLPTDLNFMPPISNGHLGSTVFGDAIYVNGVYNGHKGDSRRARLPNWLNITAKIYAPPSSASIPTDSVIYSMNLLDGSFQWVEQMQGSDVQLQQRVYAHRFYNRALIYDLRIKRRTAGDPLLIELRSNPGPETEAFDLIPEVLNTTDLTMIQAITKEVENESFQPNRTRIYIAFSDNLHERQKLLQLERGQHSLHYRFVLAADQVKQEALKELNDVLARNDKELFAKHTSCWNDFWDNFRIDIEGNLELSRIVNAGIFYLASALPSFESNIGNSPYYGLSPTGLSRGQLDADYEGHNFWDTEIWMLPVVTQLHSFWSQELFKYRLNHIQGAMQNANLTGFEGARFPWESAFTGTEVTNPCCPEVATQEIHISADIAVALRQFYATTYDRDWLCGTAWPLVREIASFLSSRTEWNKQTDQYHIRNVMGPDEDHENVDDNVYTNVASKLAFQFAGYAQVQCAPNLTAASADWRERAKKMVVLYDAVKDYHPQHLGYQPGEVVKQADTILVGYPLQLHMANSTRFNDLSVYENVTRHSGPAMTWSMFAINFLDIGMQDKANHHFIKGYKEYVRPEFKVWSETKIGFQGSANFLTGIGGFMQSIINGYAGIRFQLLNNTTIMTIRNTAALPGTSEMTIKGIKFANSTFSLNIKQNGMHTLKCLQLGVQTLVIAGENIRPSLLFTGFTIQFKTEILTVHTS